MLNRHDPMPGRVSAVCSSLAIVFAVVAAAGVYRFYYRASPDTLVEIHRPTERAAILARLADSIVPEHTAGDWVSPCAEIANVKRAVDARLASLAVPSASAPPTVTTRYVIDFSRYPANDPATCTSIARDVDSEVKRSWALFALADAWRENAGNRSDMVWGARSWRPNMRDIETRNAWAVLPGCIRGRDGAALGGACDGAPARGLDALIDDPLLADAMAYRLADAALTPAGRSSSFRGKQVPAGSDVVIGLNSALQARAVALAQCFTGDTHRCAAVLPKPLTADWHFQAGSLRAGAAAAVIVRVRDGEVVAATGAISDCSRQNLERPAEAIRVGGQERIPVFRPGTTQLCAQLPDRRGAQGYLSLPPMLWPVGPGSTMKSFAMLAGIESGVVPPSANDAFYRTLLARSHDPDGKQAIPQRIARQSAPQFRRLLENVGFTGHKSDILFGSGGSAAWNVAIRSGFSDVDFAINEVDFAQIQGAKKAGRNADAIFGQKLVADYLRAHTLGIAAIGSGDIRHSAWGLADWTRRLVLRSQGIDRMVPTHIAEITGSSVAPVDLNFAKPDSVRRLIGMLNSATSSHLRGTAAGSCSVAFGYCPPAGHPAILFSKTGTSEATDGGKASPFIKAGGAGTAPAKLFMAAFVGADGEVYAGGSMTLRIRERPGSTRPELDSNSAAELLLLIASPLIKKIR